MREAGRVRPDKVLLQTIRQSLVPDAEETLKDQTMSAEAIMKQLKAVAEDAEDLIKATAGDLSERAKAARGRLVTTLEAAQETCERLQDKAAAGAKATDKAIRNHPYESIGIAFGVGLVIGVLVCRGRD
jgi:ElaB/YqjD/DUF883 family membrane-anchored ribosome-binding protein